MIKHEDLKDLATELLRTDQHILQKIVAAKENTKFSDQPTFTNIVGSEWLVNNAFLALPIEEIKFALRFHLTPLPPLSPWKVRTKILFNILRIALLIGVYLNTKSWFAVLLCFGFTQFGFWDKWEYRRKAKHLEELLSKTDDLISARTYLVRKFGEVHYKIFGFLSVRENHPIGSYIKFGKNERIKAILRSDLTHPSPENPDSEI